jgi:hypothetical protein
LYSSRTDTFFRSRDHKRDGERQKKFGLPKYARDAIKELSKPFKKTRREDNVLLNVFGGVAEPATSVPEAPSPNLFILADGLAVSKHSTVTTNTDTTVESSQRSEDINTPRIEDAQSPKHDRSLNDLDLFGACYCAEDSSSVIDHLLDSDSTLELSVSSARVSANEIQSDRSSAIE